MAKDSSFDIVSTVDMQEVDNACQQAARELTQRYDLKGSGASLELNKADATIVVSAPAEFVAQQVIDLLSGRLVKRQVDLKSIQWDDARNASSSTVRVVGHIVQGLDSTNAKKISQLIRDQKFKAKASIDDDKVRVSSASRDVLQSVIAFVKEQDLDVPVQFVNYR